METLRAELLKNGKDVHFVAINGLSAKSNIKDLTDITTFPILQDNEDSEGWDVIGGSKDDFYIYDSTGALAVHLPVAGTWTTNLGKADGWEVLSSVLSTVK